jgi:hypothetical protein
MVHIAARRGMVWVIENPASSLIGEQHRFQEALAKLDAWRVVVDLSWWGAPTKKPVMSAIELLLETCDCNYI